MSAAKQERDRRLCAELVNLRSDMAQARDLISALLEAGRDLADHAQRWNESNGSPREALERWHALDAAACLRLQDGTGWADQVRHDVISHRPHVSPQAPPSPSPSSSPPEGDGA